MKKTRERKASWRADINNVEPFLAEARAKKERTAVAEAVRHATFDTWLKNQTPKFQELAAELAATQERLGLPLGFRLTEPQIDKQGRPVFGVYFSNGHHHSHVSYEAALEEMVDAWRTRVEDKPETHARIQAFRNYAEPRRAVREAVEIGQKIRNENPGLPIAEHDALVLAEIEKLEKKKAAEPVHVPRENP